MASHLRESGGKPPQSKEAKEAIAVQGGRAFWWCWGSVGEGGVAGIGCREMDWFGNGAAVALGVKLVGTCPVGRE